MPINLNLPNFLQAPIQEGRFGNLLPGLVEGFKAGRMPRQAKLEDEQQRLANALTKAKTVNEERFGGLNALSGPAREIQSHEVLKNVLGPNHPAVKASEERLKATLEHTQASAANMRNLVETSPKRYATPQGKLNLETAELESGFYPGASTQYTGPFAQLKATENDANRMIAQRGLELVKKTTDPFTRRGLEQAINIHKTREGIDPVALTAYSGIKGGIKGWGEVVKDQFGDASELYQAHQQSLVNAKQMAKQVRQLLGDSISAEASDALNELTNPSTWKVSPETAILKYEAFMRTLDSEIETFYNAAENPETFNRQFGKNAMANDLQNHGEKKAKVKSPEGGNLKPPQGTFTEANIKKAAKEKKWSKEKTDFVLKRYGYG